MYETCAYNTQIKEKQFQRNRFTSFLKVDY